MRCRPSELYHIHNEFAAFCFDRAVATFGTSLEAAVREAGEAQVKGNKKDKAKISRAMNSELAKWIGGEPKGQFRDPAKG